MKDVIILTGNGGSGKDWLADKLVSLNAGAQKFAFADKLREELCKRYSVSIDLFKDNKNKPLEILNGLTYREALMEIATELKTQYGNEVCMRHVFDRVRKNNGLSVISDFGIIDEINILRLLHKSQYNVFVVRVAPIGSLSVTEDTEDFREIFPHHSTWYNGFSEVPSRLETKYRFLKNGQRVTKNKGPLLSIGTSQVVDFYNRFFRTFTDWKP